MTSGDPAERAGASPDIRIRPATDEDLPAAFSVTWRCDHGDADVPTDPEQLRYLEHEVATGRMAVAERPDGEVVAMGGTIVRGGVAMVSDLFVDPDWHGRGIGARLLTEVLGDTWPRQTFSSAHPNALPLYIRAGMAPRWPSLYVAGDPRTALDDRAPGRFAAEPDAEPAALAELERSWGGPWRPEEHTYWGTELRQATAIVITDDGRSVGFAYLTDDRPIETDLWIASASVAPDVDVAGSVAALTAVFDLAADRGVRTLGMSLPGPHPATVPLIRAGWRIVDRDLYVASEPGLIDPERRIPDPTFA